MHEMVNYHRIGLNGCAGSNLWLYINLGGSKRLRKRANTHRLLGFCGIYLDTYVGRWWDKRLSLCIKLERALWHIRRWEIHTGFCGSTKLVWTPAWVTLSEAKEIQHRTKQKLTGWTNLFEDTTDINERSRWVRGWSNSSRDRFLSSFLLWSMCHLACVGLAVLDIGCKVGYWLLKKWKSQLDGEL